MKSGDLVKFVWASGMSRRFAADTVGVIIERVRSYGSYVYYSVLVNGKIEVIHENELDSL